jgi:hypothetical protein
MIEWKATSINRSKITDERHNPRNKRAAIAIAIVIAKRDGGKMDGYMEACYRSFRSSSLRGGVLGHSEGRPDY